MRFGNCFEQTNAYIKLGELKLTKHVSQKSKDALYRLALKKTVKCIAINRTGESSIE